MCRDLAELGADLGEQGADPLVLQLDADRIVDEGRETALSGHLVSYDFFSSSVKAAASP